MSLWFLSWPIWSQINLCNRIQYNAMDHLGPIPFVATKGTETSICLWLFEAKHKISRQQLLGDRNGDLDSLLVGIRCNKSVQHHYDPTDIDVHFGSLLTSKKGKNLVDHKYSLYMNIREDNPAVFRVFSPLNKPFLSPHFPWCILFPSPLNLWRMRQGLTTRGITESE